jgi:signal peptidase I
MSEFEPTLRQLLASGRGARFRVTGDSMHPAIHDGDYVRIEPCDPSSLRPGDVVLTKAARGLTAHRMIRWSGSMMVTRGDNALRCDAPVRRSEVLGRVLAAGDTTNISNSSPKSATIVRLAVVLVRRLRGMLR